MSYKRPCLMQDRLARQDHVKGMTALRARPCHMQYHVIGKTATQVRPSYARPHHGKEQVAGETTWRVRPNRGQDHISGRTTSRARPCCGQDHVSSMTTLWARPHVTRETASRVIPRRDVTSRCALLDAPNATMAHQRGRAKKTPLVDDVEEAR